MKQNEWDQLLVESFYKHPDAPMWRLHEWEMGSIQGLKRVPSRTSSFLSVARFVCECLPNLAKVLWKMTAKDIGRIVRALAKSGMDTQTNIVNYRRNRASIKAMQTKSDRELAADSLGWSAYKDHRLACSRSAWSTCK